MVLAQAELPFADVFVGKSGASIFPGGFNRSTFAVAPRTKMLVSGSGYEVIDEDGRHLIDFNNNFTALVHGNAHPAVVEAAIEATRNGTSFGMPNFAEVEHASLLLERLPYMDQVRYANSGTEAVMLAVRVARAATGRDLIVFVDQAYHGTSDVAALAGPGRNGIPAGVQQDVQTLPINSYEALEEFFASHGERLAALILDTMPNRAGLIPLETGYIQRARELTTQYGAVLISDEVIQLRQAFNGSMFSHGVTPDMMTVGKIVGGGFAVGAVLGRAQLMSVLDPTRPGYVDHGGTFTGNPVSMRAGERALELFDRAEVERINRLGARLREQLRDTAAELGWDIRGAGSLARIFVHPEGGLPAAAGKSLWFAAYERGVAMTQNNLLAISTPMDESVVDEAAGRLAEALIEVRHAQGNLR